MPRSGTTLVEQIISSHSKVTGAGELNYVEQYVSKLSINSTSSTTLALSDFRKKYLFELSKVSNGKSIVTDKMPQNFLFIPLICAALPEAKLFMCNEMLLPLVGQITNITLPQKFLDIVTI